VGIRSNERVGVGEGLAIFRQRKNRLRQILEIDLMNDAGVRRNDAEVLERLLTPAEKCVALLVAFEFAIRIDEERRLGTVLVDLHRMVDDEIDGLEWIDLLRVAAEPGERVAHCGEVDDGGNAGEILEEHAGCAERDFLLDAAFDVPLCQGFDVRRLDELSVLVSEEVLEEDLETEGKAGGVAAGGRIEGVEAEIRVVPPADFEGRPATERVRVCHLSFSGTGRAVRVPVFS
jgi:hypothetical protein